MKSRNPLLYGATVAALFFTGTLMAQNAPAPETTGQPISQATYQTPKGEVVVKSLPAPAPKIAPPPSFNQLSGGSKVISAAQATAYPPLANDFLYVDGDHNGNINKTEYSRWVKRLQKTSAQ
jgi:hypothetical protein